MLTVSEHEELYELKDIIENLHGSPFLYDGVSVTLSAHRLTLNWIPINEATDLVIRFIHLQKKADGVKWA